MLDIQDLKKPAIDNAFKYDNEVIIEEAILGREVGCAIIGKDILEVGLVDEIELADGFLIIMKSIHLKLQKFICQQESMS